MSNQIHHTPVLLKEVLNCLTPKAGESYLDLTAGYGGHARAILAKTAAPKQAVLVVRCCDAFVVFTQEFSPLVSEVIQKDFLSASRELAAAGRQFDMILADLGVSSPHLETPLRGFSIKKSGPLDMRMDQEGELLAAQVVNEWPEKDLAEILKKYGEEPKAGKIARQIVANRPITSTDQLAAIVAKSWRGFRKIHPATRTFQAIRIAVNDELDQLTSSLPLWLALLKPNGRLAIISFHSLEDRIVKDFLADHSGNTYDAELQSLTKKPIQATKDEIVSNPRARSAKLRAAAKINI